MEGDTDAKTTEGRIGGAEEEGGGIARALVVHRFVLCTYVT